MPRCSDEKSLEPSGGGVLGIRLSVSLLAQNESLLRMNRFPGVTHLINIS